MAAAYDNLPDAVRDEVAPLWAEHDWSIGGYAAKYQDRLDEYRSIVPPVLQPVVMVHPSTGRRTLFVNRGFTTRIEGMEAAAGDRLLDMLIRQADVPEYQLRIKWERGMVVYWDNFAVQHYAVNDFWPQKRTLMRATIDGGWQTGVVVA
jgi:taurine dioxygenase